MSQEHQSERERLEPSFTAILIFAGLAGVGLILITIIAAWLALADARLRAHAQGCDSRLRQELAAEVTREAEEDLSK